MSQIDKLLKWCLGKGEKGIIIIAPNETASEEHITKARHNLEAMDYNLSGGFSDWAVSAAFYAMYHAFLAILFKFGYESRNQECTINTVEYLIREKKINLDQKYVEVVRSTKEIIPKDAKSLREEFQYGTAVSVNLPILTFLKKKAIELVEAVQIALEDLK